MYCYRRILAVITFLGLIGFGTSATAQEDYDRASQIAQKAMTAFQAGNFEEAGGLFREANAAYNDPTLAKSAMYSFFKGGLCEQAMDAAAELKRISPGNDIPLDHRDEYREVQVNCHVGLARAALADKDKNLAQARLNQAYTYGPNPVELKEIKNLEAQIASSDGTPDDPDELPPELPSGKSNTLMIVGWVTTGVGAAILAGTGIYYVTGPFADTQAILDENCGGVNDQNCQISDADQKAWNDAADTANALIPVWIGGSVVTAAGIGILIYHYAFASGADESAVYIVPDLGQGKTGVQIGFQF